MGEVEFQLVIAALPEGQRETRGARLNDLRAHPECAALLLAVNASARDADARSVAADWFEERGEPEVAAHLRRRAALIRLGRHPGWVMRKQSRVVDVLSYLAYLDASPDDVGPVVPGTGERFPIAARDVGGSGTWLCTIVVSATSSYGEHVEIGGPVVGAPVRDVEAVYVTARAHGLDEAKCTELALRANLDRPG